MIDPKIRSRIVSVLKDLEESNQVQILYACESGSRAWGFASRDSDYDVRFVYCHPKPWYLSVDLEDKRDVVELPIDDELDVNGWDLRKALQLFRKSNPPLMEWLGSPIVYLEASSAADRMRSLARDFYSSTASAYHYLHMARGNFREHLKGPIVWRKKYFYVLRPLLAIRWIEKGLGVVPTEFENLVSGTLDSGPLIDAIDALIVEKAAGAELDRGDRIDEISEFVESEIERLEKASFAKKPPLPPVEPLNELFRTVLDEISEEGLAFGEAVLS